MVEPDEAFSVSLGPGAGVRVLRSTLAQWVLRALTMTVSLATVSFLTRQFGAANYGRLALIATYTILVSALVDGGISLVLARELSRRPEDSEVVGSALRGRAVLSLLAYVLSLLVASLLYRGDSVVLLGMVVSLLALLPTSVFSTVSAVYQVRLQLSTLAAIELVTRAAALAVIVGAVLRGGGVLVVIVIGLASVLTQTGASLVFFPAHRRSLRAWDRRQFTALMKATLPLGLAVILNSLYARLDVVLISLLRPVAEVGRYVLAYRVMELALTFAAMFASAALPVLSRAVDDVERFGRLVNASLRFVSLLMLPAATCCLVLAHPLVLLLGGAQFTASAAPLRWLSVAVLASGYNIVLGIVIIAFDGQRRALWLNVSGLMLNLVLNLLLIPIYGIVGAAAVTSLSEALVTVGAFVIVRQRLGSWPSVGHLSRLLPAGIAAAAAGYALRDHSLLLSLPVTLSTYGTVAVLTRQLRRSDFTELTAALSRGRRRPQSAD